MQKEISTKCFPPFPEDRKPAWRWKSSASVKAGHHSFSEPTNHLDMDSIAWLETYLLNYPGAVFIVSHDRYFLDKVATKIVEIDNTKVTSFTGNYSAYSEKKAMLRRAAYQAYINQQQEIKHQEEVIAKLKSFNREKSIRRAESRKKCWKK